MIQTILSSTVFGLVVFSKRGTPIHHSESTNNHYSTDPKHVGPWRYNDVKKPPNVNIQWKNTRKNIIIAVLINSIVFVTSRLFLNKVKILLFQGIVNTKVHLMRCYVECLGFSLSHCIPLMFFAQPLLCEQISKMFKELLEPLFRCKGEEKNKIKKNNLLIPWLTSFPV